VILRQDGQSTEYFVSRTKAGWRMSRIGATYDLWQNNDRIITCSCKGHKKHRHCKHASWLSAIGIGPSLIDQEAHLANSGRALIAEGHLDSIRQDVLKREQIYQHQLQELGSELNSACNQIEELTGELTRTQAAYDDLREKELARLRKTAGAQFEPFNPYRGPDEIEDLQEVKTAPPKTKAKKSKKQEAVK